ncbi:hypothetical protein HHI36_020123, partial [Cryptolaemus montrouzieri]
LLLKIFLRGEKKLNDNEKDDESIPEKLVKEMKNKHIKRKSFKRKVSQKTSSDEVEEHFCNSDNDMNVDDEITNVLFGNEP